MYYFFLLSLGGQARPGETRRTLGSRLKEAEGSQGSPFKEARRALGRLLMETGKARGAQGIFQRRPGEAKGAQVTGKARGAQGRPG